MMTPPKQKSSRSVQPPTRPLARSARLRWTLAWGLAATTLLSGFGGGAGCSGSQTKEEESMSGYESVSQPTRTSAGDQGAGSTLGDGETITPEVHPNQTFEQPPFWGHSRPPAAIVFSNAGDIVFTVAPGEEVVGWDVATGQPLLRLAGRVDTTVTGAVIDTTDHYLAVGGRTHVYVWDLREARYHGAYPLPFDDGYREQPAITAIGAIYQPGMFLIGDALGRVMAMDYQSGEVEHVYHTGLKGVQTLVGGVEWLIASDAHRAVALDRRREPVPLPLMGQLGVGLKQARAQGTSVIATDGTLMLRWGPDFSSPPVTVLGPPDGIQAMTTDAYAEFGLILTTKGRIEVWDMTRAQRLRQLDVSDRRPLPLLAADISGGTLASADVGGVILWQTDKRNVSWVLPNALSINTVDFIPGTHNLVAAGVEGRPIVYNVDDPRRLITFPEAVNSSIVESFVDRRSNAYFTSTTDGQVQIFELQYGRIVETLSVNVGGAPELSMNSDRKLLALAPQIREHGASREPVVIWDISSNRLLKYLDASADIVDITFGAKANHLYYLTRSAQIETWDLDSKGRRRFFDALNKEGRVMRMDPANTMLAVGGEKGVSFYNARLDLLTAIEIGPVVDIAFDAQGRWATVAADGGRVYVVRFDLDQPVNVMALATLPSAITSAAASDDGALIAVSEERGAITFFDARKDPPRHYATLLTFQGEEWLVHDAKGQYWGSDLVDDILYFNFGNRLLPRINPKVKWARSETFTEKLPLIPKPESTSKATPPTASP